MKMLTNILGRSTRTTMCVLVVFALLCAGASSYVHAEMYDNTIVTINHDPFAYEITGYNLYNNCPQSDTSQKVLLAQDVIDGAVIDVDINPVSTLNICVTAMITTSNGPAETGPFAFEVQTFTDPGIPANGTVHLELSCKNPACTKVIVTN